MYCNLQQFQLGGRAQVGKEAGRWSRAVDEEKVMEGKAEEAVVKQEEGGIPATR